MLAKVAVLLCFFACASCAVYVTTNDCANVTTHSRNVRMEVSGCSPEMTDCPLHRGSNHTVVFTFEPTRDFMNKTDFRVYGVFSKFSVPYGKKADACHQAVTTDGITCNSTRGFVANHEYKHTSLFAVSNNYPMIKLGVRFHCYDRRHKLCLFCKEVRVEIKDTQNQV